MISDDTQNTAPTVHLRSEGEVDGETLVYARTKIDAVVGRPGLPAVAGEVRITRASARHAEHPWSATAALHVGRHEVVVLAEAATGHELVDQLQDLLRRQTEKATRTGREGHRAAAPPWRGGAGGPPAAEDGGGAADPRPR